MRRRVFQNQHPLTQKDVETLERLPFDMFPTISDFFIEIRFTHLKFGNHLYYASRQYGDLISFPWWDHVERDLQKWTMKNIPLGYKGQPYYDLEQGWQLIAFRKGDYVYLLQGGGVEERKSVFHTWIRVPRDPYLSEWQTILERHAPPPGSGF